MVILAEWRPMKLGDCLVARPSYGINAPAVPHSSALPAYVRITDINDEGRLGGDTRVSVAASGAHSFFLSDGDLVFARTGASVGKSYMYRPADGELVYAGFLIRVRPDQKTLVPGFLAQYARSHQYWEWVRATSMRSGQPGINSREYAGMPLQLPPLKEQEAIAEALGDADAAIEALDALIAKKRDVKQAAMQQLLTGRTRLPGFSGEWQDVRFGEVGRCLRGVGYNPERDLSERDTETTVRLLRSNNVQQSLLTFDDVQFVDEACVSSEQLLRPGDLVVCMANGSRALVGKSGLFRASEPQRYTFGAFMGCFRTNQTKAAPGFIRYLFLTKRYQDYINNLLAGSAINNLAPSSIESLGFEMPPFDEQEAIAEVLSDMDAEIEALVAQRDKMRLVKQGMMQELLSGRVRLL